ncbi:hypothetical protein [Schlesneria paludicola]|uniref:hypothetical protein n=1 Tax=Schlesneria paludicola TaxID=360056 RepID=UPI0012F8023B|nr:hypothetical protein [Schlesneria paludicola]
MPRKPKTIRYATSMKLLGLPLLAIACGPDASKGEAKGWARGIIAIGDMATGLIAIGGLAGGGIAVGGVSLGAISIGGVALGGMVLGGVAVGLLAMGGVAVGHYAKGGSVVGTYVVGPKRCDPEAARVFNMLYLGSSKPAAKEDAKPEHQEKDEDIKSTDKAMDEPADASKNATP